MSFIAESGSWLSYAEGSDGPDFAAFCESYIIQSVDEFAGQPLELEDWQQATMGEALAHDALGRPVWRIVVILLPRKNGKTAILAAYALWRLLTDDGQPEIILAASSDEQAGRLFDAVVAYLNRNPVLREMVVVREYVGEVARADGGGIIKRLSSDAKRLHGYNPSVVICDELAQWTTPTLRNAWAALTTGGGARRRAQVFAITTAGEAVTREDGILGQMLDRSAEAGDVEQSPGLDVIRSMETRTLVFNYQAPWPDANPLPLREAHAAYQAAKRDGRDASREEALYRAATRKVVDAWQLANPASWISDEFLTRQALAPELGTADVLQLHAGIWAAGEHAWITRDAWISATRAGTRIDPGEIVCLGFDGSRFSDATALVACRLDDGFIQPLEVWEQPRGATAETWEVPRREVDAAIHDAFKTYHVARLYADPPHWQTEIEDWAREFGDKTVIGWETFRERQMSFALERFETDFAAGLVTHNGDDTLRRHVTNALREKTRNGYGIRKPAKNSDRKIDSAVAMVLAYEARCDCVAEGYRKRSGAVVFM